MLIGLFIATVLDAYDQTELTSLCDVYYSECETTTNCDYPSTGANACDSYTNAATADCTSETSNNDFAKCFMDYNTDYFTNCTEFKYLSLCLFEETKDLDAFSCYNGGTTAVDCPSSLGDGMEFDLQSVDYDTESVPRGSQYWTVLTIDFGTLEVTNPPDSCVTYNNITACTIIPWQIPHMNLHACLMTDDQKTCSCLMLENTDTNVTVSFTDSNSVDPTDGPFDMWLSFDAVGTYRLIAHIQFYEDMGNDETTFWDMANGIELTVIEPDPTAAPTVKPGSKGTDSGNIIAIAICLSILACYGLIYAYYKLYYEPHEYVFDDVDYDLENSQDETSEVPVGDDLMQDKYEYVTTGVAEN